MKLKSVLATALFFAVVLCLRTAAAEGPSPSQAPVLPSMVGQWTASGQGTVVPAGQLEQIAQGNAPILREYGISSAESRDYTQGADAATITVYNMTDPSAAFGAFTFLRGPDTKPLTLTGPARFAAGNRDKAFIVVGNLVIEASSARARPSDQDLAGLASALSSHADQRPFPIIEDFLPKVGLVPESEVYVLGPKALAHAFGAPPAGKPDWIGFNNSAEAIVARYHLPGDKPGKDSLLLVALYPTQQIAADEYGSLSKLFALNTDPSQSNGRPAVFGTRSSALIALLSGSESRDVASKLLGQIHYSSDVTWNEPTHELTDPSISTMIVGAILDTGTIMMLAIAAGVGFGGFRLFMKFVLPGRVFDRNEQIEILQLGLTSKPISSVQTPPPLVGLSVPPETSTPR